MGTYQSLFCEKSAKSRQLIPSEDVLIVPFCLEHSKSLSILSVGLKRSIKSNWFDWVRKSNLINFSRKCFASDWVRLRNSWSGYVGNYRVGKLRFIPLLCKSVMQCDWSGHMVWMSKSFTAVTTNTRPRMFLFLSGWNLSFLGRQSTVSMVFSRALTKKVPSSLNEGRRKSTRIISHDDHAFNFIYLIKMKDYIVKTTRSLRAEWVRAIDNFVYMMTSSKCRPGTILENLYPPQNFVPVFLYTAVWSLESQFH